MADEKEKSLVMRCKQHFGLKPGETLLEFMAELKKLTDQDKKDLVQAFNDAGMPTVLIAKGK